jgi:hypothetical protein
MFFPDKPLPFEIEMEQFSRFVHPISASTAREESTRSGPFGEDTP